MLQHNVPMYRIARDPHRNGGLLGSQCSLFMLTKTFPKGRRVSIALRGFSWCDDGGTVADVLLFVRIKFAF